MIETGFSDMARRQSFQRHGARLRAEVATLSNQMTTGVLDDRTRALQGDFALLASVKKGHELSGARQRIAQDAQLFLEVQQNAIADIRETAQSGVAELSLLTATSDAPALGIVRETMRTGFEQVVARLNTSLGGRSIMAGVASDSAALAPADAMLDALQADLPANSTPADIQAYVEQWFAPGGGFDAQGYTGGPARSDRLDLGNGITAALDVTAADPALRSTLAALATGALLSEGVLVGDPAGQRELLAGVSASLIVANDGLIGLAARVGIEEEQVARAASRASAEENAMQRTLAAMTAADPYDTATRLEAAMSQLDTLYALTVRLSRLSLSEYL